MISIRVEITGESKRAVMTIKALAHEIAGTMGLDGVKRDRSAINEVYIVQFRTHAQADRFCRALERFVPSSLARIIGN